MDNIFDVIIIGGGAAGMFCAIWTATNGKKTVILEKNDVPGKKLLATGNGKCNFTNKVYKDDSFRGDKEFAKSVYEKFDYKKTLESFEKLGVYHYDRDGYCYPYSRQAKAVNDCLLHKLYKQGVTIVNNVKVTDIVSTSKGRYKVTVSGTTDDVYYADKVVIATGGKSYKSLGGDSSGYMLAKKMGHKITDLYPALVRLHVNETVKKLEGVRVLAAIKLSTKDKVYESRGEIIFGKTSVSGIPIFEISRYAAMALCGKADDISLYIDFFPNLEKDELMLMLSERQKNVSDKTYRMLIGLLNEKLAAHISNNYKCKSIEELVQILKNFELTVKETGDFEEAQVCAGGVDTCEINPDTMESLINKGLYFAGEVVNVDGNCGGYNLQWAWSSAYIAGNNC